MYNRYIPQADGSFRRSRVPEPEISATQQEPIPEIPNAAPMQTSQNSGVRKTKQSGNPIPMRSTMMNNRHFPAQETNPGSVGSFLKGLLPKNFDTEDLIVVLLLLLISGNSAKDQNAALMTLGIYLFM